MTTTNHTSPSGEDAANGAIEELRGLPWLDNSTADPIEKARRVLMHLIEPNLVYYFEDGFPRPELKQQASNCLAVLNALASKPGTANGAIGEREAFEAYMTRKGYVCKTHMGAYVAGDVASKWDVWQARAALTAEKVAAEPVTWERLAVAWLRGRAAAQDQNNERWPEHAKAYDRWRYYVTIAQALADELEGNGRRPRDSLDPAPQPAQTQVALTVENLADELENMLFDLKNGHDVDSSEYARLIVAKLNASHPTSRDKA